MRGFLLIMLTFACAVQADMLDALKAYEQKNYAEAQQQFAELLPLGNELAAFNLGAMAYQGEGQNKDLVKAIAYFMLAAELKHGQAKEILSTLTKQATELQLDQATQQVEQLTNSVVIGLTDLNEKREVMLPQPIKRTHPKYPLAAAKKGLFGFVKVRLLVNEEGDVTAIDTLDAYPKDTFERATLAAVKKWRYEATGQKHILHLRLDYSLGGGVKVSAVEKVAAEHKLWQYSTLGSPQHQLALGMLLSLVEIQSQNSLWYDPELPLVPEPDFAAYENRAKVTPDFDGFWGRAKVRVNPDGIITEQLSADFEDKSEVKNLVGLKLNGKVDNEVYQLNRSSIDNMRKVYVVPSVRVSRAMSAKFWWEQAAKNGNPEAQRIMAAYDSNWENYLLSKQDAEVMAWTGTRLMLEGQREQGMALLEQAIAKNYQPAKEMKKQFM